MGTGNSIGEYRPGKPSLEIKDDFDIRFSINRDSFYKTVVPFGILDFNGKTENAFFAFNYQLMQNNVDQLQLAILDEEGNCIFSDIYLPEIVITVERESLLVDELKENTPPKDNFNFKPFWDFLPIIKKFELPITDYTKVGTYTILWDGFDNEDVFDSTRFNNKKLTAVLTAQKDNIIKKIKIQFHTSYSEVDWVDVKIDRNNKRIDTTLRVNLTDGGEKRLKCTTYESAFEPAWSSEVCPWDKIPKNELIVGKSPIKTRTKTFEDLEKLALDRLNYHWGRNQNHAIAKDVKINEEAYEVYVNAVNTKNNSMDDVELVYNTNNKWLRSGNPGSATWNPISWVGNLVSREAICYNVRYIKGSKKWRYREEINEDIEFKFTSAHEIGHEILKSYGGTVYSYGHKGSVNVVTQSMKENAPEFPSSGEIDIMPYYPNDPQISMYNRYTATEKDVLSLIWLTKLEVL